MSWLAAPLRFVTSFTDLLSRALGGAPGRPTSSPGEARISSWLGPGIPAPQAWTQDRMAQAQRYRGWPYIAIRAIAEELAGQQPQAAFVRSPEEMEERKRLGKKALPGYLRRKAMARVQEHEELEPV